MRIATGGITLDLLAAICDQLAEHLPGSSDPDMALNNLERFVVAARNPLSLASLFERDREALPILLQIFATSQHLSDLLITDTKATTCCGSPKGSRWPASRWSNEFRAEVAAAGRRRGGRDRRRLRRFKRRETLRIAYGDIIRGQPLDTVTRQISYLADAIVEAALAVAIRRRCASAPRSRATDQAAASSCWPWANWAASS